VYAALEMPMPAENSPRKHQRRVILMPVRRWWWAAAAVLVVATAGFWWTNSHQAAAPAPVIAKADVPPPVGARTTLTLSSGRHIYLDSRGSGAVATDGAGISKTDAGTLEYTGKETPTSTILYNTLSTAKGGQTSVVLPDGTRVWLNALSSLRYPTAFTAGAREVELTGEGYFEVAHDNKKPFRVKAGSALIEDVGTHFDVNAYSDEPSLTTTLLEGAVRVNGKALVPGDQAAIIGDGPVHITKDVDIDDVIAWKDGLFRFHSAPVRDVLRQAERWYDVDIDYKGTVDGTITGGISRHVNLSQLLHILELTRKVTFSIEGKHVTVQPLNTQRRN